MTKIEIKPCAGDKDLQLTAKLANVIWHEYFPFLLTKEQIDYMVDKFCSFEAMKDYDKHHNYHYFMVYVSEELVGYIALGHEETRLFLSKLYLKKEARGHRYASQMFDFIKAHAKKYQYDTIYLTCNKHNTHSIQVYEKLGFHVVDEDVTDIGQGYVMDDVIMEYDL